MNLGPTDDRETNIQWHHNEQTAHIYTCDERIITRLKKNPAATVTAIHHDQTGVITGFEFDVPVWAVRFRSTRQEGHRPSPAALAALRDIQTSRRRQSDPSGAGS
jgi:hypothetical protein